MIDPRTTNIEGYGPTDVADIALCKFCYELLEQHYPGHRWFIGADSSAGIVTIDLPYEKPIGLANYGWLLHISSIKQHDEAKRKVLHAGGELLERFNLPRTHSADDSFLRAKQNRFDITGALKQ